MPKQEQFAKPTVLVIPDSHTSPGQDLSRFDALGQMIVDVRPDVVVELGDFMNVDSLSHWNMHIPGKMENLRFEAEIDTAKEAVTRLFAPLRKLQETQRHNRKKVYKPLLIHCDGNHEDRVMKYAAQHPQIGSTLLRRMDYVFSDYEVIVPYKAYHEYAGILFTHVPCNAANRPVTGKYALARAVDCVQKSVVFGHLHRREQLNFARHAGNTQTMIQVMSAGAFFNHVDEYAQGSLTHYCRCVQLLHITEHGRFDAEEWSIKRLMEVYGGE